MEKKLPGSLIDFRIYFSEMRKIIRKRKRSLLLFTKLEHYKEARWWNEIFNFSKIIWVFLKALLKLPQFSSETITASFQLDEILYELKEHSSGLNCGRWDYIFSYIKNSEITRNFWFRQRSSDHDFTFMSAYSKRGIQVCHKRGVHAMGGMAANSQ